MHNYTARHTVLLTGWLFADLLLGLMVIFLVSIPGIPPLQIPPPQLTVSPSELGPQSSACKGQNDIYTCTITLKETSASINTMTWLAQNDMSQDITFSPASGILSPGKSILVTISSIPCQTGSFTFSGSRNALPVSILWKCALEPLKLDFQPQSFNWTVSNPNALLNNDSRAIADLEGQVQRDITPKHRRVGLFIVYAGAPTDTDTDNAHKLSDKVADILTNRFGKKDIPALKDASGYSHLHVLNSPASAIHVDVFFFNR